ncbi:TPA: tyrosine-type recombinase/integrase [Photobacterium damselae]
MNYFSFYSVEWISVKEFEGREIPIVFFDGEIAIGINQWLIQRIKGGISATALEESVRSIGHLYNLQKALTIIEGDEYKPNKLLANFIDAKVHGTDEYCTSDFHPYLHYLFLGWKPVSKSNIKNTYLRHINDFDLFQAAFHKARRLNPSEHIFMTSYEKYKEFVNRTGWDMLLHLFPSKSHSKEVHEISIKSNRATKRAKKLQRRIAKCFPADQFIDLIELLNNPRDKLLFLMYGAGSLRRAEPTHLFMDDILGIDEYGMLKIRLADPEFDDYIWINSDGIEVKTNRNVYIRENYKNEHLPESHPLRNLQARSAYLNKNNGLYSGFKGMTFSEASFTRHEETNRDGEMFWCNPDFGQYAAKLLNEYLNIYIYNNPYASDGRKTGNPKGWPYHPFLFINIDKSHYGMPLTISAINSTMKRVLKKIGLEGQGFGLHSLRHLFGFYCATVLELPIEKLKSMFHHADISSTQIYYHLSDDIVRYELMRAYSNNSDENKPLPKVIKFNKSFSYKYPLSWRD